MIIELKSSILTDLLRIIVFLFHYFINFYVIFKYLELSFRQIRKDLKKYFLTLKKLKKTP
jgi:hypothetical protein